MMTMDEIIQNIEEEGGFVPEEGPVGVCVNDPGWVHTSKAGYLRGGNFMEHEVGEEVRTKRHRWDIQ